MRIVTGEVPFNSTYAPTGLGKKFDDLSGAELTRWALRNSVPNVSADLGRQAIADAISAHLGKIHKDAGDQAVAKFLADNPVHERLSILDAHDIDSLLRGR